MTWAVVRRGRLEREHAVPMLPPSCAARPADTRRMMDQRGGGRLAVGAGDGDERRIRRKLAPLAAVQLDVADHLDAGGVRKPDRPMRRRMGQRHARRQQRAPPPSTSRARADRRSQFRLALALSMLAALSSKAITSAPPATSACALASPEPPRPNTATRFPAKLVTGIMARSASPSFSGLAEGANPQSRDATAAALGTGFRARRIGPLRNDVYRQCVIAA